MKNGFQIFILAIVIIIGLIFYFINTASYSSRQGNPNYEENLLDTSKKNIDSIRRRVEDDKLTSNLRTASVVGMGGNGVSGELIIVKEGEQFVLNVSFLNWINDENIYEGFLLDAVSGTEISTGLVNKIEGSFKNIFKSENNLSVYDKYIVKLKGAESNKIVAEAIIKPSKEEPLAENLVGSYGEYEFDKLTEGKNILFFSAVWCSTCQALKKDILKNEGNIPADLTILDIDFDNSKELRTKYGVTIQHTLVQVDKDGNFIKKWSGGNTLDTILSKV